MRHVGKKLRRKSKNMSILQYDDDSAILCRPVFSYCYIHVYCSFISRASCCLLQSAKLASLITYKLEHHKAQNVRYVKLSSTKLGLWEVWEWTKRCRTLCLNLCQVFMRKKWKEEGPFMSKVSCTLHRFPYMVTPLFPFDSEVTFYACQFHITHLFCWVETWWCWWISLDQKR